MDGDLSSVAAAANFDHRVEIFGISRVGNIFHRWELFSGDAYHWSPMAQMDGQLNSIAAARNHDGTLWVFGTNSSGNIFTRSQVLGGDQGVDVQSPHPRPAIDNWTSWQQMDGVLSQVAAVTGSDGLIHIFGVNSAGMLFHRQQNVENWSNPLQWKGVWTSWEQLESPGAMKVVSATLDPGGRINIFALTKDNRLFQRVKLGNGSYYTGWSQIPGTFQEIGSMNLGETGQLVLVGVGGDARVAANGGGIYRNISSGQLGISVRGPTPAPWPGWVPLPNPLMQRPIPSLAGASAPVRNPR